MDTGKTRARIEAAFPNLSKAGYELASEGDVRYNCIAWAAGRDDQWWEPSIGYFWPKGVPRIDTVDALTRIFRGLDYEFCEHGNLEGGFDKIAIFADQEAFTHVARQLENGKWTSKIGTWEDIIHNACEGLEGEQHNKIARFMKRKKA